MYKYRNCNWLRRPPRTRNQQLLSFFLLNARATPRAARDQISANIEGMTLEEELKWLAAQELQDPLLRMLLMSLRAA